MEKELTKLLIKQKMVKAHIVALSKSDESDYAESETGEYFHNDFANTMFPDAFKHPHEFVNAVTSSPTVGKTDWSKVHPWGGSPPGIKFGGQDLKQVQDQVWSMNGSRWLPKGPNGEDISEEKHPPHVVAEAKNNFNNYFTGLVNAVKSGNTKPTIVGVHKDSNSGQEREHIIAGNTRAMIHTALGMPTPTKHIELKGRMRQVNPNTGWFDPEDVQKSLKGAISSIGLAAALSLSPGEVQSQETPPVEQKNVALHPHLVAISHLESSGGKNVQHKEHPLGKYHTAVGELGIKPVTAHEEWKRNPVLKKEYPGLEHPEDFQQAFSSQQNLYRAIANSHWNMLRQKLGMPDVAAYGWRYGLGAAKKAKPEEVQNSEYIQKFKQLTAPQEPVALNKSLEPKEIPQKQAHIEPQNDFDRSFQEHLRVPNNPLTMLDLKDPRATKEHFKMALEYGDDVWDILQQHPILDEEMASWITDNYKPGWGDFKDIEQHHKFTPEQIEKIKRGKHV